MAIISESRRVYWVTCDALDCVERSPAADDEIDGWPDRAEATDFAMDGEWVPTPDGCLYCPAHGEQLCRLCARWIGDQAEAWDHVCAICRAAGRTADLPMPVPDVGPLTWGGKPALRSPEPALVASTVSVSGSRQIIDHLWPESDTTPTVAASKRNDQPPKTRRERRRERRQIRRENRRSSATDVLFVVILLAVVAGIVAAYLYYKPLG